jgi:hypothetical protein
LRQSKADDDGDSPGPGRQGQRQRVESEAETIGLVMVAVCRRFQFLLAALAEELPAGNGEDEAAGARRTGIEMPYKPKISEPSNNALTRTKNAFRATRQMTRRWTSWVALLVMPRKTRRRPRRIDDRKNRR